MSMGDKSPRRGKRSRSKKRGKNLGGGEEPSARKDEIKSDPRSPKSTK